MPGEVRGEVLGVDLPPGPVEGDPVEWHPLDLDDEVGLVALGGVVVGDLGLSRVLARARPTRVEVRELRLLVPGDVRRARLVGAEGRPQLAPVVVVGVVDVELLRVARADRKQLADELVVGVVLVRLDELREGDLVRGETRRRICVLVQPGLGVVGRLQGDLDVLLQVGPGTAKV